jgi:hypothetical protein
MKQISATLLLLALVSGAFAAFITACADNTNSAPPQSASNASPPEAKSDAGGGGW